MKKRDHCQAKTQMKMHQKMKYTAIVHHSWSETSLRIQIATQGIYPARARREILEILKVCGTEIEVRREASLIQTGHNITTKWSASALVSARRLKITKWNAVH